MSSTTSIWHVVLLEHYDQHEESVLNYPSSAVQEAGHLAWGNDMSRAGKPPELEAYYSSYLRSLVGDVTSLESSLLPEAAQLLQQADEGLAILVKHVNDNRLVQVTRWSDLPFAAT